MFATSAIEKWFDLQSIQIVSRVFSDNLRVTLRENRSNSPLIVDTVLPTRYIESRSSSGFVCLNKPARNKFTLIELIYAGKFNLWQITRVINTICRPGNIDQDFRDANAIQLPGKRNDLWSFASTYVVGPCFMNERQQIHGDLVEITRDPETVTSGWFG